MTVVLEQRYDRTPDGAVWTPDQFDRNFWQQYLHVFDAVRVLARVRQVQSVPERYLRVDDERVEVEAVPYYVGPWQYLKNWFSVRRIIAQTIKKEDAYILRVSSQLANVLSPMLERKGIPYAVQVVCDPLDAFAPGVLQHPIAPLMRKIMPWKLRRQCHSAVAASYVTEKHLQRRYPCPRESFAISSVQLQEKDFRDKAREYASQQEPFQLVFVGSLAQRYKGVDVLLKALAHCQESGRRFHLNIIGDGKYREEYETLTGELGLTADVHFVGSLAGATAVREYLDQADALVHPSKTEGLPRAVIEAMSRALPVLASRVGGIPELLAEEDLVCPGDEKVLAEKMMETFSSTSRLEAMSARNLKRSRDFQKKILDQRLRAFFEAVRAATEIA